jgi:hypothetical protein
MAASQEAVVPSELPQVLFSCRFPEKREVTSVDYNVIGADHLVVAADQFLIHLLDTGKRAPTVSKDVLVPIVLVGGEEVHPVSPVEGKRDRSDHECMNCVNGLRVF